MNTNQHNCYYCGQPAYYQLKNGYWCCCKSVNSCPARRLKNQVATKLQWAKVKAIGNTRLKHTKTKVKPNSMAVQQVPEGYCQYGCGQKAYYILNNGVNCCSKYASQCPAIRAKNSKSLKTLYNLNLKPKIFTEKDREKSLEKRRIFAIERAFKKGSTIPNSVIKKHMLTVFSIPEKCNECGLTTWMGKKLTLELDHIDGDSSNNELSNLRLLCPNCHSQTKTFRGRGINKGKQKISDEEFIQALKVSKNIKQALEKLGLSPKGANYIRAYKLQMKLSKP